MTDRTAQYVSLKEAITGIFGEERRILQKQPVSGGDINEAYAVILDNNETVFLKKNSVSAKRNFEAESDGLCAIAGTDTIRTPRVLAAGTDPEGFSFLLLSYISSGTRIRRYWEEFARELAAMHAAGRPIREQSGRQPGQQSQNLQRELFGFYEDNYIGHRIQKNTWHESWISFYRECRLAGQFRDAEKYFDAGTRRQVIRLLDHLDQYLIEPKKPSLVHGDLWAGNFMTGDDGKAWLIDPAVYYGHPETDIAMTELFGGFSPAFYDAYRMYAPLEPGYADRRDLYHLYQLLNHLNMFGRGYLSSVTRIVKRYGGSAVQGF